MSNTLAIRDSQAEQIERVLIGGDLGKLNAEERVSYYRMVCESVGLNPLTKPFEYITLNGKLTLYARKDATDQLRNIHNISVTIAAREVAEDCYVVTARATTPANRTDESIGAVSIGNLKGEARANAMMKCETKAKRRVTLSICGLGILDETEIETIPSAKPALPPAAHVTTEDIHLGSPGNGSGVESKGSASTSENGGSVSVSGTPAAPQIFYEQLKQDVADKQKNVETYPPEMVGNDTGRKTNFAKAWDAACVKEMAAPEKKAQRKKWLERNGFVWNGRPTSGAIPIGVFEDTKKIAVKFAKTLRVNPLGICISDEDVPF